MSDSSHQAALAELRAEAFPQEPGINWHGVIVLAEWALLTLGVVLLLRKMRSIGGFVMLVSLVIGGLGGIGTSVLTEWINRHDAIWAIEGVWATTTLLFCAGFLFLIFEIKGPNQSPQANAGSRPPSDDSPTSEAPSSLAPRG